MTMDELRRLSCQVEWRAAEWTTPREATVEERLARFRALVAEARHALARGYVPEGRLAAGIESLAAWLAAEVG